MRASIAVWLVVMFAVVGVGVARADVIPPGTCTSPGQPCQVAGPRYNEAGICVTSLCTKYMPDADGGGTTMRYNCNMCEVSDAGVTTGAAGDGDAGGGGHGTGGSPGTGGTIPPNCCGGSTACAVAPHGADSEGLGTLGLLAALGLTVFRRRRVRSTKHAAD